ncbi:hypothetical protein BH11PSE11_BH11PSE11_04240 [soil metagenome]
MTIFLRLRVSACALSLFAGLCGICHAQSMDTMSLSVEEVLPKESPSTLEKFTSRASELGMRAMSLLGIRYKYGGTSPEHGLDCSGLVRYLFKETWGANLPRTSEEISRMGQHIDTKDLQTGDLVFYNTLRRGFSHVGVYLGENKFIHSPAAGGSVRIESMDVGYWKKRFNGARRLGDPTALLHTSSQDN